MIAAGEVDPAKVLSQDESLTAAVEAYEAFDQRESGWIKVMLEPAK